MEIFCLEIGRLLVEVASTGKGASRKWYQRDYNAGNWIVYQSLGVPGAQNNDYSYTMERSTSEKIKEQWVTEFNLLRARLWLREYEGPAQTFGEVLGEFPPLQMPKYRDNSGGTVELPCDLNEIVTLLDDTARNVNWAVFTPKFFI